MGYLLIQLPAPPAHADGRVLLFQADHVGVTVENVVVLIDYENIRQSGYRGIDDRNSVFDPSRWRNSLCDGESNRLV